MSSEASIGRPKRIGETWIAWLARNFDNSYILRLNKDEVQLDDAHKRTFMLSNVLKNAPSFDSHNEPNLTNLLVKANDETTKVEELKMLNDVVTEPLLDLDKCSLSELITILQKFAKDPSINANQAGFGSYIANHVLKEKIDRYNKESMIPPKLGDLWTPKIQITIGKVTWHAILDLGSSVSALSKELYTMLELPTMEKCNVDLLLADDSTKHALGRVDNVMVELHMTFVPVDFIIMDMGSKSSNSIILGRPFLRTTCAIIDSKEGNVRFQFPHKKCMEHFPRKKEAPPKCPHTLHPS